MIGKLSLLGIFFYLIAVTPEAEEVQEAKDEKPKDLDTEILLRRLQKFHGEQGRAEVSDWDVAWAGRTERWRWNRGNIPMKTL